MGAMGQAIIEHYGRRDVPTVSPHGCTDKGIITELFTKMDIDLDADHSGFFHTYCDLLQSTLKSRNGEVLPGVIDLLETLNAHPNVALGILTGNGKRAAEIKLDHFGLREYFLFGGYGDDHADRNKVASQAFDASASFLDSRFVPEKVWVIGDTPNDIRCGRSIGAKVLAVETGGASSDQLAAKNPDLQLCDLSDVSGWLSSLAE